MSKNAAAVASRGPGWVLRLPGVSITAADYGASMSARVLLIGKPGCHLCDEARAVIAQVCAEMGESFEERSILDDPALAADYAEEIPVTLVDGRRHDFFRVDPRRLRAALERQQP